MIQQAVIINYYNEKVYLKYASHIEKFAETTTFLHFA